MVENRRHQIIKNLSPEVTEDRGVIEAQNEDIERDDVTEEEYVEYPSSDNLLDKRVFVPMPIIILGFITLIFMTITSTYVAMNWPAPGLDFSENPELARFEAAANPGILPEKIFSPDQTLAVNSPVSDLGPAGVRVSRYAGLQLNKVPTGLERSFRPQQITSTKGPVVNLLPQNRSGEIVATNANAQTVTPPEIKTLRTAQTVKAPVVDMNATLSSATVPVTKAVALSVPPQEIQTFAQAIGVDAPTTLLTLTILSPVETIANSQTIPQRLMRQRLAKAVMTPSLQADGNPLLQTATGQGLPVKTANLETATGVSAPVADLQIEPDAGHGGYRQKAGTSLEVRQYTLRETPTLTDPVVDLILAERQSDYTPGLEGNTGLVPKDVTLTEVFGLDSPAALLNLPVRRANANANSLNLPNQKLMQRRYAKAVTNPEQMGFIPAPREQTFPDMTREGLDPWQRFAAAVPANIDGKGRIVIIIDDMGNNSSMARALGDLDGPLNFSFLPYAPNLQRQTSALRDQGHELLVHMPMEPMGNESPGPNALLTSLSDQELLAAIDWNLTRFEGFVGVNNHMGSRFTKDSARMKLVMEELQKRGLLFLDSRTAPNSEGAKWAKRLRMPWAGRDVFLDNEVTVEAIMAQLKKVEVLAQRRGTVIAIGHPHQATLKALQAWIPTLAGKGLVLVPLSSIVEFEGMPKLASAEAN